MGYVQYLDENCEKRHVLEYYWLSEMQHFLEWNETYLQ